MSIGHVIGLLKSSTAPRGILASGANILLGGGVQGAGVNVMLPSGTTATAINIVFT